MVTKRYDINRYILEHEAIEYKLRRLSVTPRNRRKLSKEAVDKINLRARPYLPAGNFRARICMAKHLLKAFEDAQSRAKKRSYFFVTLVPSDFSTLLASRDEPDLNRLRGWTGKLLSGMSYVAGIDAGVYRSLSVNPGRHVDVVSWHVHAIVWDETEGYIADLVEDVNASTKPLLPGFKPAHKRKVSWDACRRRLTYAVKFPHQEYQAYSIRAGRSSQTAVSSTKWKQRSKDIRTGTAARIATLLAPFSLDQVVFGGGQGSGIIETALSATRVLMAKVEERRIERLFG